MKEQTCKKCGCTENNACVDKDGVSCYWVEDNLCSECKTFVFFHSTDGKSKPVRIERKESELKPEESNLLYGELISIWNNNTKANRNKFLEMLSSLMMAEQDKDFEDYLNEPKDYPKQKGDE